MRYPRIEVAIIYFDNYVNDISSNRIILKGYEIAFDEVGCMF